MIKRLFGRLSNGPSQDESSASKSAPLFAKIATLMPFLLSIGTAAQADGTVLATRNAISICTTADEDWINFCNGLFQGYADVAVLSGNVCIPAGTTRTAMVALFTGGAMIETTAYQNDEPALVGALKLFRRVYPCN